MHAYILNTGRAILPFERPVADMKMHNRTLGTFQEQTLRELGCTVERIDSLVEVRRTPCLLVFDDLYFTYHAMAGFLKAVRRRRGRLGNARAALRESDLTERFTAGLQGDRVEIVGEPHRAYDCFYVESLEVDRPLPDQAEVLPIPYHMLKLRQRVNRYFEPSGLFIVPVARVFMTPVRHWSTIITANMLGMPSYLLRCLARRPFYASTLALRPVLRSGSLRPSRLLSKLYLAGRRCHVAPSAHVECSVLGHGVHIGPNAVVRNAVIGDHTHIGAGSLIEGTTIAKRVNVDAGVRLRCCVVEDEANMGSFFTQLSVLGRGAVLCPDAGMFDFRLHGDVEIKLYGERVPSGSRLLGGCLGDRSFMGPGVKLLAGQEVPNDCILIESPRHLIRDVDGKLPENILRMDARNPGRPVRRRKAS